MCLWSDKIWSESMIKIEDLENLPEEIKTSIGEIP